jgi:hypothetical protein
VVASRFLSWPSTTTEAPAAAASTGATVLRAAVVETAATVAVATVSGMVALATVRVGRECRPVAADLTVTGCWLRGAWSRTCWG